MADNYVGTSYAPDELLTSTKMNVMATDVNNIHNGSAIADDAVGSRQLAPTIGSADANGWVCYDMGSFKIYCQRVTFSVTKNSGEYSVIANPPLPVGMNTIGGNRVKATLACQYADDVVHGLKTNNTGVTSLPYSIKALASATFSGWVEYEIRTP